MTTDLSKENLMEDEKPVIYAINSKPPGCLFRESNDEAQRTLIISGHHLPSATLQFLNVLSDETSIHFAKEVDWASSTEIRVDMATIKDLLWPNIRLRLRVRLCSHATFTPLTDWSEEFLLADNEAARTFKGISAPLMDLNLANNPHFQISAIQILGQLGDLRAAGTLIKLLHDDEEELVRASAAAALGNLDSEPVVEPLITALSDVSPLVQRAARSALSQITDHQKDTIVQTLISVLNSGAEFTSR